MKVMFLSKRTVIKAIVLASIVVLLAISGVAYLNSIVMPTSIQVDPIYQGKADKKAVALTVNVDWGEENIPKMLDIFEKKDVKATFFLSGRWAEKHPELAAKIAEGGHEIGNHGHTHPHPDNLSIQQNIEEIKNAEAAIKEATGVITELFAPAYGEKKPHVAKAAAQIGYKTIYWSLDTIDWQNPKPQTIVERIVPRAFNGAIVLMHPKEPTVLALPEMIHKLKEQGYEFMTVTEIIS
ncbi:putative sporulation protein (polysaccharide deacetylase family) [Desulfitispora alkaliphila]